MTFSKALLRCIVFVALAAISTLAQSPYKVLWSFGSTPDDGTFPVSTLISDAAGNLYGTTTFGGAGLGGGQLGYGGTVFELSPQPDGSWSETTLYDFCTLANCADGAQPKAGLVTDAVGNLYGTTEMGGASCPRGSCGTVFELSPPSSPGATWTESVLHAFCTTPQQNQCLDGNFPTSQLVFDGSGNLYGTASQGGSGAFGGSAGVVFELSPGSGGWSQTVLYNFCSVGTNETCKDGAAVYAGVTLDKVGNLYGTTQHGGQYRLGVVYELSPVGSSWTEKALTSFYKFGNSVAPISLDAAGNLYSTTLENVFQLNVSHHKQRGLSFTAAVGGQSSAGVLVDPVRNALFGTGSTGLWEVNPARQLISIYDFCAQPNCADGEDSQAGLFEDPAGSFYGTTEFGGAFGEGVVFEITP